VSQRGRHPGGMGQLPSLCVCVRVPSVGCVAEWLTDKPVNCVWSSRDVVVTARAPSRTCCPLMVVTVACQRDAIYYSAPDRGARSIVMSVSVCLSLSLCLRVCLSVHDHISRTTRRSSSFFVHVTCGRPPLTA